MTDERTLAYAEGLGRLIQCETISEYNHVNLEKMHRFHDVLKKEFPVLTETVEWEEFNGSLLLKWKGTSDKEPAMFMNHHDVVETPGNWTHEPFSGDIADGKLWGRGTLDTKGGLYCMLQAAEELMKEGYVPERDIYFESACTEEVEGSGCDTISKELKNRGMHFYMTLDEGGMIVYDPIGGADGTFAMIGVGEKGVADYKFTARSNGGHAASPAKNSPLVRLGKFMVDVEKSNLFPAEMSDVTREMLRRMGPAMKFPLNKVLGNPDKFEALLKILMPMVSPTAGALLKTTLAFTTAKGSDAYNSMPDEAYVTGNMRFSHHQGATASIAAVKKVAKKYDIEVEAIDPGFESRISDYNSEPFHLVEEAVHEIFPGVIPAPYVTSTASDSRYMDRVCDNCIRLTPFTISDEQMASIHGVDENVDLSCLAPAVDFYKYLMKKL